MTFGLSAAAIGGIAAGAGAIGGAMISSNAAEDAAATQAGSAGAATAAQERMFNKQLELQEPWRQSGMAGLSQLNMLMGLNVPQTATGAAPAAAAAAPAGVPAAAGPAPQFGGGLDWNSPVMDSTGSFQMMPAQDAYQRYADYAQRIGQPVQTPTQWWNQAHGTNVPEPAAVAAPAAAAAAPSAVAPGAVAATSPTVNSSQFGSLLKPFSAADFTADPGYAFRLSQGEKAATRAAMAQGGLGSGKYLKDLTSYGQGMASQEYGNAYGRYNTNQTNIFNRLAGIAGIGQQATNQSTNAAGNFGQQVGSNIIGAGNALAAGQVGGANAWNNAIGQGLSLYQTNSMLNRLPYDTGAGISPPNPYYLG